MPVPDLIELHVAAGVRVLVVSDLHLSAAATRPARAAADALTAALDGWTGPGVCVLAGDILELLSGGPVDPATALEPYGALAGAARRFGADDSRRIVYLVGNHDGRLAWDADAEAQAGAALGATVALAADLVIETALGPRRVRVEHGHRFDPANALSDPRDPLDTPIGHHVAAELLPALAGHGGRLLRDIEHLDEPGAAPRLFASRLLYRILLPWAWLLLLPPALAATRGAWAAAAGIEAAVLAGVVGLAAAVAPVAWRVWSALASPLSQRGWAQNDAARAGARRLAVEGYAGLVTGHTHHAELGTTGAGFYANTGCCTAVVERGPARCGFPTVFATHDQLSWVELEGGADVTARLVHGRTPVPGSRLERMACRRPASSDPSPQVVASLADGSSWPPMPDPTADARRPRRVAAAAIGMAGLLDVVSALSPPLADRLVLVRRLVPFGVPELATALVALAGLALLLLARGVRRGQRRAWRLAVVLLLASPALHIAKGADIEEALATLAVAAYLLVHRRYFPAASDRPSFRRGMIALSAGPVLVAAVAAAVVEIFPSGPRLSPGRALAGAAERLVGVTGIALPSRAGAFLSPTLMATGIGLAVFGLWLAFRPVVSGRRPQCDMERARAIVHRYGGDTLAYFALRDDKEHFFHGESLVAYAVCQGTCLVSPDPIGPRGERRAVWAAFRRFADGQGWKVAVLGAGEDWLAVYRAAGMRSLYVGDEGVVDVGTFRLDGGRFKGLRQAVNRIAKYGYRIEFHDPAQLDPVLQQALCHVMTQSRRGDVERGFSMTLGRIFDRADDALLLAVAFGPDGRAAAFAQFVPAPGIGGFSLDLMRRSDGDHPNGLTDFVTVRTIEHLRERGYRGLGLNFATMRAVLAGETGAGPGQRAQRWALRKLSASMQIESLWRYNAKFAPAWQPRYAVYDAAEDILPAALAVAKVESFWELPVIGRFLVPKSRVGA